MKVTLVSTTQIVDVNGHPARVWEGETAAGVKVYALIPRIAAHKDADLSQFEAELQECAPPSAAAVEVWPSRLVI